MMAHYPCATARGEGTIAGGKVLKYLGLELDDVRFRAVGFGDLCELCIGEALD